MKISDDGIEFIRQQEGVRHSAYLDSVGIPTIGVGHTGQEVKIGLSWTDDQIDMALRSDLSTAEDCIAAHVEPDLTQSQYDALVSFIFNVGCHAFKTSTLLTLINAGNMEAAAQQFGRWNKAGGRVIEGLAKRREAERELFEGVA